MAEYMKHYSAGIEEIDNQHLELLARFDRFVAALDSNEGRERLAPLVAFLAEYTNTHFATEEGYHRLNGYPGAESHREEHRGIRNRMLELRAKLDEEGASDALVQSTSRMLVHCLSDHFCKADKAFADFIRSR